MIITLCGSTRFSTAFDLANMHLSLMGHTVISVGMKGHADDPPGARHLCADGNMNNLVKQRLDELHFKKIDLSDGIYVVNVGNYIGESTRREMRYAQDRDKEIWYMFPMTTPGFV